MHQKKLVISKYVNILEACYFYCLLFKFGGG
jgi:hypothetical protein